APGGRAKKEGVAANVPKFPRRHRSNTTPQTYAPVSPPSSLASTPGCFNCVCSPPPPPPPPPSTFPNPEFIMSSALNKTRRKKNVKKGIQFCLMVCGASGTGRTTFVNTLCGKQVLGHKEVDDPTTAHVEEGVKIKPITVELDEEGTRISLTIVDTPGFGDQIDNEASFSEIVGYLERQYDGILAEESRIKRNPRFRDDRVHVLLYFITPTGHGLRELDIELMKRLSPRCNVIPVIGKADSLTPAELAESKKLVMEDIEHYRIPVYNFPYDIEEDDEDTVEENAELRGLMPFAIVGSEDIVEINGRRVRARQYPWGIVEVDNPRHSDFLAVRSALLHSHLADLKEITHDFLYENYRTEKLSKSVEGGAAADSSMNPEDLASQSVRLKEEQLRREEEKLREIEVKVQREINEKRQELLARESQLKEIEARMNREQSGQLQDHDADEA
ncbi:neuronal-specific septin-3, partial [Alternaria burnsii]